MTIHASPEPKPRKILYGLPCRRCHAYFSSDLDTCPKCGLKTSEPYEPEKPAANSPPAFLF